MGHLSDEYYDLLDKEQIRRYLVNNGWSTSFDGGNPAYDFFVNHSETGMEYVVSLRKASITQREIRIAVEGIAGFYMIEPDEAALLMTSKSTLPADYIFCRLFEGQEVSSIPLSVAKQIIDGGIDLIRASAYSEYSNTEPSKYYSRKIGKGVRYADQCKMSHTSRGSFGVSFECPLSPIPIQKELFDDELTIPTARKITRRIANGVRSLAEAITQNTCNVIVDGFVTGLNGNMCEALMSIYGAAPLEKTALGWKFSHVFQGETELLPPLATEGERAIKYLDDALQQMRPTTQENTSERVKLTGYVIRMESRDFYSNREGSTNEIVIEASSGPYEDRNIKMRLDTERYTRAIAAHEQGAEVEVTGVISKQGRSFVLSDIEELSIITKN